MYEKQIKELYEKISASICKSGCSKCCRDIIQFSPSEEKSMGGYEWNGQCSHLFHGRCTIYNKRPFLCRIFGTSELLQCENCKPEKYLSEEETVKILHAYSVFRNQEIQEQMRDNRKKCDK